MGAPWNKRPAQRRHHPEGNQKFLSATVSTFSSYDPPKTPSPRFTLHDMITAADQAPDVVVEARDEEEEEEEEE